MHIPDGSLGPPTCGFFYAVMVPIWIAASWLVRKTLKARQVPMLAICAAFSFVIMMINVPIPGGTTGHAVGSVLVAILLGPWAATIAITVALVIQALLFGDGGITAIGANCFNMAFAMPFVGYYVYKVLSLNARTNSFRQIIAAGVAGYIGINVSALLTAIEFGLQPLLHHTANGQALYFPYGLRVAIPVMTTSHLLIFGWIEAVVTALVVKYLQKQASQSQSEIAEIPMKLTTKLWIGIATLVVLSPLGLILPSLLGAGSAWGEWSSEELKKLVGYVPRGLEKLSSLWSSPMPAYSFNGGEEKGLAHLSFTYIISAIVGIAVIALVVWLIGKILSAKSGKPLFMTTNFVQRSIVGTLSFLKESIFADEYAAKAGFLQLLDPRIKVITFLLLIISIMITKSIVVILWLYVLCLVLTYLSQIRFGYFLKRTWIFIPIFSIFIVIPSLFSVFSPGTALATLNIFGIKLTVTQQGLSTAELFVMRVITSVSFAILLSITTRHFELLKVLRIFRIPQVFVMTVGMCYRYIFLFVETVENTYLAIKSRIGSRIHYKKGQHIVAWNITYLWNRSRQLNEEVYNAMLSRGYRGEPVILNQFKMKLIDVLWLCSVVIITVVISIFSYMMKA